MAALDDLDYNPFYRALQTKFLGRLTQAQKNCWLICIPHIRSIRRMKVTDHFVDIHLLKPSPYFKAHYLSSGKQSEFEVELMDDNTIQTPSGPVKVLAEEVGYNESMKKYSLLIVEKPLDSKYQKKETATQDLEQLLRHPLKFLQSAPCRHKPLSQLDRQLQLFVSSYIVLPNFLDHAAAKVASLCSHAHQEMLESHPTVLQEEDPLQIQEIALACESYVGSKLHSTLWPHYQVRHKPQDSWLHSRLVELSRLGLDLAKMGLSYRCSLHTPIVLLKSLDSHLSPALKLLCLKSVLDAITESVNLSLNPLFKSSKNGTCLTSDDYISLLLVTMAGARPPLLPTTLHYIEGLSPTLLQLHSFVLVTFKAAMEYAKIEKFTFLNAPTGTKEANTVEQEKRPEVQEQGAAVSYDPLDRKLDRMMSKILSVQLPLAPVPQPPASNSEDDLGCFLSGLRLSPSYGK